MASRSLEVAALMVVELTKEEREVERDACVEGCWTRRDEPLTVEHGTRASDFRSSVAG